MVMADVFAVVFSVLAIFAAVPAFFLVSHALTPRVAHQAHRRFAQTPKRLLPIGLMVSLPLVLVGIGLLNAPWGPVKLLGLWWSSGVLAVALAGAGGLAHHIGTSVLPSAGPTRRVLAGAVALELTCLLPFLGWFVVPPLVFLCGLGAITLAVVRPLRDPEPVQLRAAG